MREILKSIFYRILSSTSLKKKLSLSYILIIALLLIAPIFMFSFSLFQTVSYDKLITNVSLANRLNQTVRTDITNEVWNIVAGNERFVDGDQYEIIDDIRLSLEEILLSTNTEENQQYLEVANRALNTVERYVIQLGRQIDQDASYYDNEKILEEIRGVTDLMYDILQEYIVAETESTALANESLRQSMIIFLIANLLVICFVTVFARIAQRTVLENISYPLQELEELSTQIALGNLDARAEIPQIDELTSLSKNLNVMAEKISLLIKKSVEEQKNLQKAEMQSLQAQITPHFLYNTFDTIIWLAEAKKTEEVTEITRAFSTFFRISLSKGKDWITVEQEFEHIRSYLTIQKIRYRDILDYEIFFEPELAKLPMLKLVLQPLVENALYHGIKNKRGKGKLIVSGKREDDQMVFTVCDNGIGFQKERLEKVISEMQSDTGSEDLSSVYGLYNVNKRLQLYYSEQNCISIESVYKSGTTISFYVPMEGVGV